MKFIGVGIAVTGCMFGGAIACFATGNADPIAAGMVAALGVGFFGFLFAS